MTTQQTTKRNRFAEAFREGGNLVGLAGAAGLSLALLNPLPLLVGLVAEAAYLLFVPDSKWYESRLGKRFEEAIRQRREELKRRTLPLLSPSMQDRFARLEATRVQIYAQAADNQEQWFDEVLRKLDYLLEKFLLFASKEVQFQTYLRSIQSQVRGDQPGPAQRRAMEEARRQERGRRPGGGGIVGDLLTAFDLFEEPARGNGGGRRGGGGTRRIPVNQEPAPAQQAVPRGPVPTWVQQAVGEVQAHYDREIATVNATREAEPDENTKAILDKRKDVLERRREYIDKIGKILTNLQYQLELLEDTFGLINDQIRARSPEQVLADIEGVVFQTDSMTRLLEELAPLDQMADRLAA